MYQGKAFKKLYFNIPTFPEKTQSATIMKKSGKVRKGFRNFILSKIAKSYKDNEFLDVNIKTGNPDEPLNECIFAHKFILGALSPVLHEALENNPDDEILIIIPDFNASTLRDFISLSYGYLSPDNVDRYARTAILELCKAFGDHFINACLDHQYWTALKHNIDFGRSLQRVQD